MRIASVGDLRAGAQRRLPRVLFDYIDGAAYDEATAKANLSDLADLKLRQRVLVDVSRLSMGVELFGEPLSMPVVLAPVGLAGMYASRGEVQAAKAAKAAGVPFSLSTMGVCSLNEVAQAATPPWFQLYMIKDRPFMADVLSRAREVGCPVLFFTVDLPLPSTRRRDVRNAMTGDSLGARLSRGLDGLAHPGWVLDLYLRGRPHSLGNVAAAGGHLKSLSNFWAWTGRNFDASVTWKDIEWVRENWPGPLVLKGILDPEDAREAARAGADGIVVSNHGGRQLDGAPSSIAALPAIVEAVGSDLAVLMDGGVRSGLDVLKALASGAQACLVGRAWAWALGARGGDGVAKMLAILRQELRLAMSLTGCTDVRRAGRDLLA
ncbi:MAG: L-lactate dehydrogenase [Caulobacteraceae bacterium]